MQNEERQNKIIELIKKNGTVTYDFLTKNLYISESTARREILKLETLGIVKQIYKGASLIDNSTNDSSSIIRENSQITEKKNIALKALQFIKNDSSYFFDSSTTISQLIVLLTQYKNLTIVTNGLNNAELLNRLTNFDIYLSGGKVNKNNDSTQGNYSMNFFLNFQCDYSVFSCRGINRNGEITEASADNQIIKQIMIGHSKTHILLVDNTKFEKTYLFSTCKLKDIDVLITDKKPPEEIIELCKKSDVKLIY